MAAVTVLASGATGNYTTTLTLGAGVGRYLIVSKGFNNDGGYSVTIGTQTFNGAAMTKIAEQKYGDWGQYGWVVAWGLAISDGWAAGNYNLVGSNQRQMGYTIFANVDNSNPFYANHTGYDANIVNIYSSGLSMDPSGGGFYIGIGTTSSSVVTTTNLTDCRKTESTQYAGNKLQTGGTFACSISPTAFGTSRGCVTRWSFRAIPSGGSSSVIWWFKKWIKEKKKELFPTSELVYI